MNIPIVSQEEHQKYYQAIISKELEICRLEIARGYAEKSLYNLDSALRLAALLEDLPPTLEQIREFLESEPAQELVSLPHFNYVRLKFEKLRSKI